MQQLLEVTRPGNRHGDVANGVFENQIPADDPSEEFAQGGVGVGIGRAGHGHHRGEFRVTERRESTGDERNHQRRSRARRVHATCRRRADGGEDARADNGSDAEERELQGAEAAFELAFWILGVAQQSVARLEAKESFHPRPPIEQDFLGLIPIAEMQRTQRKQSLGPPEPRIWICASLGIGLKP